MHDHVAEVEQHPLSGFPAFHPQNLVAMPFRRLDHLVHQGFDMAIRGAAGDDHVVGDVGQAAHLQGNDIPPLAVFQRFDDDLAQTFGRQCASGG